MKIIENNIKLIMAVCLVLTQGCGSSSSTNADGSGTEVASSAISGAAQASEGSVALLQENPKEKPSFFEKLKRETSFSSAWATTCANIFSGSTCSGSTLTEAFGTSTGCTTARGTETWTGNLIYTWTTGSCVAPNPLNSAANAVFTRTTDTTGLVRTIGSNSVTMTTQDSSGYSTAKTGGFTATCGASGCSAGRTLVINGVHYVGTSTGISKWDHTVSTDPTNPLVMTGSSGTRSISSGTIITQHNLAKFISTTKIATTLTHTAGCCFPTGGSVTTTYTGGTYDGKSETLAYSSTCGSGTLTKADSSTATLTLTHCL